MSDEIYPAEVKTNNGNDEIDDVKPIYKKILFTDDDILGTYDDTFVIRYRPDGVPEDYPEDYLPGLRFKHVSKEELTRFRRIYSGRDGNSGDPDRAEKYLLKQCFIEFVNMEDVVAKANMSSAIEYLTEHPKGAKLSSFAMTEFITREVPSVVQGNASRQHSKLY